MQNKKKLVESSLEAERSSPRGRGPAHTTMRCAPVSSRLWRGLWVSSHPWQRTKLKRLGLNKTCEILFRFSGILDTESWRKFSSGVSWRGLCMIQHVLSPPQRQWSVPQGQWGPGSWTGVTQAVTVQLRVNSSPLIPWPIHYTVTGYIQSLLFICRGNLH